MKSTNWKYDAFISYSHADRQWVRDWLIPRLRNAGHTVCIDRESFDIGIPSLVNMENAVATSGHTILVLTPAWLASKWTRFESLLLMHEDPGGLTQRILPVLLRPCEFPSRIAMLTYADLTDDVETKAEFSKVLDALRGIRHLPTIKSLSNVSQTQQNFKEQKEVEKPYINVKVRESSGEQLVPLSIPELSQSKVVPSSVDAGFQTVESLLTELGFKYNPFAFFEAEKMPLEALEDTFVAFHDFDVYIMNRERSSVLLAPQGNGKTACRCRIEVYLNKVQHNISYEQYLRVNSTKAPLVVTYNNFEDITKRLPNISLSDQVPSFLSSVAEAVFTFIINNPQQWQSADDKTREWRQIFLEAYLEGENLAYRVQETFLASGLLLLKANSLPFRRNSSLKSVLEGLQRRLAQLGIGSLFILIDDVDGYVKTQPLSNLEALVATWLNTLSLLSLQNVIWKFFLPDILSDVVHRSAGHKTRRLDIVPIKWDEYNLSELLRLRLKWASGGQIQDITQLCDQELLGAVEVEQELIDMALRHSRLGPPRALLDLGSRILRLMTFKEERGKLLSLDDWNNLRLTAV